MAYNVPASQKRTVTPHNNTCEACCRISGYRVPGVVVCSAYREFSRPSGVPACRLSPDGLCEVSPVSVPLRHHVGLWERTFRDLAGL